MTVTKTPTGAPRGKVLLTGGSGFIAAHVLDSLLDHGFQVVVTARSDEKGQRIVKSIEPDLRKFVTYVVVGNIADDGAFDEAVKSDPPFDYVIHTASPYKLHWDDPIRDCLDPAVKGTTGILKSIKAYAPSVKRVVITSSSAAVLNPPNHREVYDETSWSGVTWEEGTSDMTKTYRASKKFAEKAAWDFVASEKPNFDIATINNTYTFGPLQRSLPNLEAMNTSNHRIRDLVQGKMRDEITPTAPVFTFVDVRDVALAHVRAMMVPDAGGERFYLVSGYFTNSKIAGAVRGDQEYEKLLGDKLPSREVTEKSEDFPEDHWKFDTTKSKKMLGLEYIGLEKSVLDTVESIVNFQGQ
ncbi:putative NADPH-dependent methylglyoxal reductase [Rhypophila decipiens]|uniref:NADPH-dependent methylglyoxal reductase n=1 Tax=Rhypophila decipiens TaxID=261697 RepID=A0AAN6XX40_9PEZI|nr:putative NADPH-dependent methylglyoxal reductase [Rhypophila decipiens]